MSSTLSHRHEIIFVYDCSNSNPNGDPVDENKPRIDEESGRNLVTDVRLKRTIRDELDQTIGATKGSKVFIKEVRKDDGNLKTKEDRLLDIDIKSPDDMLRECIDIRLFGGTTAIKKNTITFTGPVQFKMGYSLHGVEPQYIKGTTVMPSGKDKGQGTFREEYVLPYSLIVFYGIANENSAKETLMTNDDFDQMLKALWNGTKNLISRSKVGQMPRMLLDVSYSERNFHLGELDKYLSLETNLSDHQIRDIEDVTLNLGPLIDHLSKNRNMIEKIRYKSDKRVKIKGDLKESGLSTIVEPLKI